VSARLVVVTSLVAACRAPAAPALQHAAPSPAPASPVPTVTRAGGLRAIDLPAIAHDGAVVVHALRASDGLRGLPNLTIHVTDRADRETTRHVVLSVAEADQLLDDAAGNNPALDARVATANAWLREAHARYALQPLPAIGPAREAASMAQRAITGDGVTVTWDQRRLRITHRDALLVDRATPPTWLVTPYTIGTGATCEHPAYLAAAHVDVARRLALVTIGYAAPSDLCGEPGDQRHVIAW